MGNSTLKRRKLKKNFVIYKEDSKGLIEITHVILGLPFFTQPLLLCGVSLYDVDDHCLSTAFPFLSSTNMFSTHMKLYDYIELKTKSTVSKIGSLFRASVILM